MKKWLSVLLVAVMAIALAGCGGGNQKAPSQGGEKPKDSPKPSVQGVTDTSIKIGAVIDLSGPTGPMGVSQKAVLETYAKMINDQGGINGRKLEVLIEDGKYDQAREVSMYKKLRTRDEVFTVVSVWSTGGNNALLKEFAQDKNVYFPFAPPRFLFDPVNPWIFHVSPDYSVFYRSMVDYAAQQNPGAKIGVIYADNAFGQDAFKWIKKRAEDKKVQLVAEVFNLTDIDATSQVSNLKKAGVPVALMVGAGQQGAVVFKAADQIGLDIPFILVPNVTEPPLIDLAKNTKAIRKAIGTTAYATYMERDSVPGLKEMIAIADKYKVEPRLYQSQWYAQAWLQTQLFGEALKRVGKNLTPEAVRDAMESIQNFDSKGITDPISFSPAKHNGSNKIKFVKVNMETMNFEPITGWYEPKD